MESRAVMERLYPELEARKGRPRLRAPRVGGRRSFRDWLWRLRHLAAPLLLVLTWVSLHVHYYNRLVDLQYNVDAARAQIEAQEQRRFHIQQNLTKISMDYARHERDVLVALTELRSTRDRGAEGRTAALPETSAEAPSSPEGERTEGRSPRHGEGGAEGRGTEDEYQRMFSRLQLVAEEYPELMLSQNLRQFSEAVVETESEIAARTMAYNDAVNVYTTTLRTFPANVFGWVCGFEDRPYHRPEADVTRFQRVEF